MTGDASANVGGQHRLTVDKIAGPLSASVSVPGSKSIANRALVCAALADGTSELSNLPDGDDVTAMLDALTLLGARVERPTTAATTQRCRITGWAGGPPAASKLTTVDAGLAGTTSRFLVAVAGLSSTPITVDGAAPLRARPFRALFDALGQLHVVVEFAERVDHLPATLTGPPTGSVVHLPGDVSSQFISALMLIAPNLPDGLTIDIETELVSRPYVELTAAVMERFGAGATVSSGGVSVVSGGYTATDLTVEPDASSASYPLALAAVLGGSVTVSGLGSASRQGDVEMARLLARMGCEVDLAADQIVVHRPPERELVGIDVDMADISDLVPTVAAVAAIASTPTRIGGVGFIRGKESDRLGDLSREFRTLGVDIAETADGVEIQPSGNQLRPGSIDTHHDHRIAMAAAVLGTRIGGVTIDVAEVVNKSWPGFWKMLNELGRS